MGFSYIVPNVDDSIKQQEFYSSVFRDINIGGKGLSALESRRSFYFLDAKFKDFFEPNCMSNIKENDSDIDFIRYLSLLFDSRISIAKGYSGKKQKNTNIRRTLEDYYMQFIYEMIGKEEPRIFKKYSEIFTNDSIKNERFTLLENTIESFLGSKNFSTFTECDVYMFGLVSEIIIKGNELDLSKKEDLKKELNDENTRLRNEYGRVSRTSLKYINECVTKSIEIYDKYTISRS